MDTNSKCTTYEEQNHTFWNGTDVTFRAYNDYKTRYKCAAQRGIIRLILMVKME